jgi:Ca-activated chloride channel family protein
MTMALGDFSLLTGWVLPIGESALELSLPLMLLAAPLPLVLSWRLRPYLTHFEAIHVPFFTGITRAVGVATTDGAVVLRRSWPQRLGGLLMWLLLVLAASSPRWVDPPQQKIIPARDLLLAVDISQSMEAKDFTAADGTRLDRLSAAKLAIDEFVRRRHGDRLGLLVFANGAHLQAPFTMDHALLRELLAETRTGMAGPRTMIGDALGLGINLFAASSASNPKQKVMILLTDGADTGSRIPPDTAARIAAQRGVVVHTIAIGQPGQPGRDAVDKVDTAALQSIANITGGAFASAGSLAGLQKIYTRLDALETQNFSQLTHRNRHPLFQWPLGAAALLLLLGQLFAACRALWAEGRATRQDAADV